MDALNRGGLRKGDLFEGCRLLVEEAQAWASYLVLEAVSERELTNWTVTGQHRRSGCRRNPILKSSASLRRARVRPRIRNRPVQ
jgi:hypothetical protein